MYVICNVVPRREGREKIAIKDYLLVDEILKQKPVLLPQIVMKHLDHVKSIQRHGITFVVKSLLSSMGLYEDGPNLWFWENHWI